MSPKQKMWLLTFSFITLLLVFTYLVSGHVEDVGSNHVTSGLFIPPEEIVAGAPAALRFSSARLNNTAANSVVNVKIIMPEYGVVALGGDFYVMDSNALVAYNFQESGSYEVEVSFKDMEGGRISQEEHFEIGSMSPEVQKTIQLRGWGLLMGVLVFGVMVGVSTTRAKKNVTE